MRDTSWQSLGCVVRIYMNFDSKGEITVKNLDKKPLRRFLRTSLAGWHTMGNFKGPRGAGLTLPTQKLENGPGWAAASYRWPCPVRKVAVFRSGNEYPVCPRCGNLLEREFMVYCDCCGQHLAWPAHDILEVVEL